MSGQPFPPAPLDTLETRLVRIEALIEELKAWVADADVGRERRLLEIREQLDVKFAGMLDLLEQIRSNARAHQ
jgi:hypothetical protein